MEKAYQSRPLESSREISSPVSISQHGPGAVLCGNCGSKLRCCRSCSEKFCQSCACESGISLCVLCFDCARLRRPRNLEPALNSREVKRSADFVAIVSRYTKLRRAGRQYVGLCPFHVERTPSFYVDPRRKLFKCFGRCDARGDIFEFVMRAEHCTFPEALKIVEGSRPGQRIREADSRLGRAVETVGFSACEASRKSSQTRAEILARLDATEKRNAAIRAANDFASAEFATDCEPVEGGDSLLLVNKRITGRE